MVNRKRKQTGITLDPENWAYIEALKREANMNRSWVINAVLREHRRLMQEKGRTVLLNPEEAVIKV